MLVEWIWWPISNGFLSMIEKPHSNILERKFDLQCRSTRAMAPYWTTLDNSYVTKEAGKVRSLASRFQIWKLGEDFVAKLLMFIWTNFELSVSGPGWKTALNRRVSISNKLSQIWLSWNEFPLMYRSVEECRIRVSALEGRVASIDNDVSNQVTIDCKRNQPGLQLNKYKKIMTRPRSKR